MDSIFTFTMFLFLLSTLLAAGSFRPESSLSKPFSYAAYFAGVVLAMVLYVSRTGGSGHLAPGDFFEGILITVVVLAVFFLIAMKFAVIPAGPAVFSLLSLGLGFMGILRIDASGGRADAVLGGHVFCMFFALAMFTLSLLFSVLFLLQDAVLKSKKMITLTRFLPPLELTSRLNLTCVSVGASALFIGFVGGAAKASQLTDPAAILLDPSVFLLVVMLVLYFVMVAVRRGPLDRAKTLAYMSIVYYILLLFIYASVHRTS